MRKKKSKTDSTLSTDSNTQPKSMNRHLMSEDREAMERELARVHGEEWLKENKARLDEEWEYMQNF